jgi:hypothetical protein
MGRAGSGACGRNAPLATALCAAVAGASGIVATAEDKQALRLLKSKIVAMTFHEHGMYQNRR